MPDFGFPAQPRQASLASLINSLRKRSDDVRTSTVTGRHADPTRELRGRVNEMLQLEKSLADLRDYASIISLSENRASTMQQLMSNITTIGSGIADNVVVLLTNATDDNLSVVSDDARGQLATVVNSLNADFAGTSLFAGDESGNSALVDAETIFASSLAVLESPPAGVDPYDALQVEFLNAGGLFDTTFYTGGAGSLPVTEVAPGERVDYGVKADETAFREVLFNMTVLAAANDTTNAIPQGQRRLLTELGADGLRSAVSKVITVQSRVGSAEERIATAKTRNIAADATFTIAFNELANKDQFEAVIELTEIENQLETAFATTSRIANLSLASFI